MRMETRASQRMEQRLLPQMLQSIEVLQLATVDLLALVETELQSNETLELQPAAESWDLVDAASGAERSAEREWEAAGVRAAADGVDGHRAFLENQPAHVDRLLESIREQLLFRDVSKAVQEVVLDIAGMLNDRGLMPLSLEDLAAATGHGRELCRDALAELRQLEPRGLGAASPVEAMLVQAEQDPDFELMRRLLEEHLQHLADNKLPLVARCVGLSLQELQDVLDRMRSLQPAPGAEFLDDGPPAQACDLHAWLAGDRVEVALTDSLPDLMVSAKYEALLRDRQQDPSLRDYLRGMVRAARDLIGAISMRKATLLRVARVVLASQRPFLEQGKAALRPLRMTEVAERLGVHPSTISRAIAGKYVSTHLGTFALRSFFDAGREVAGGRAPELARNGVAVRLKQLVDGEDKRAPLSDDVLVDRLAEQGIEVARRTVAKMRSELQIPSSYRRRRHGAA
jgi:RNA polymerase sigma-54 factor